MYKYHFFYVGRQYEKLFDYETDCEPPSVGDIVNLKNISNSSHDDDYTVIRRLWLPLNEDQAQVELMVEIK